MAEPVFGVVVEVSTPLQKEQVQSLIKENADSWWHGMDNFWIVVGKSAKEWRKLIGPLFPTVGSGKVFVVKLDNAPGVATWSYRASFSESAKEWLRENL